ncbi:MAG: single-stranded-DNA-specific exonuclease RecJ [Alphaproteobacteria bacterium]
MQIDVKIQEEKKKEYVKKISVKNKYWKESIGNKTEEFNLKKEYDLNPIISKILVSRKISSKNFENFFYPKIKKSMPDPYLICDMKKATERIVDLILKKKKIGIFGDYDVDGSTSTALLGKYLAEIGVEFEYYIPDRITEGYGPNLKAFEYLKKQKCDLIVTLDCGTTSINEINEITKNKIDVIVVDHHKQGEVLPNAYAIVNPNKDNDKSNLGNLCAAGVVFFLLVSINRELKKRKVNFLLPNLMHYIDLVALGTVCDVVKLDEMNRALVSQGLKIMNKSLNVGLLSIINESMIKDEISSYHLGYVIGPRINAGGRVGKSSTGAELLLCKNENLANVMAQKLSEYNKTRRKIETQVEYEATLLVTHDEKIICVSSTGWHPGVIGIVASKLTDKYNRPSIVIAEDKELCKASCRSVSGFDVGNLIFDALEKQIIISGGGHKMAGGFSIKKENIEKFKKFVDDKFNLNKSTITKYYDSSLALSSINIGLFHKIQKLSPFGQGNPTPKFLIKECIIKFFKIVGEGHLSCQVEDIYGNSLRTISFNAVKNLIYEYLKQNIGHTFDLIVTIKNNVWNGNETVELQIEDVIKN